MIDVAITEEYIFSFITKQSILNNKIFLSNFQ